MKPGRNDPCHCGSGKKYKKCHASEDESQRSAELAKAQEEAQAALDAAAAEAEAKGEGKDDADKGATKKKAGGPPTPSGSGPVKPDRKPTVAANPIRRKAV